MNKKEEKEKKNRKTSESRSVKGRVGRTIWRKKEIKRLRKRGRKCFSARYRKRTTKTTIEKIVEVIKSTTTV